MKQISKNMIILRSDGGISSQIEFCALGLYLENKFKNIINKNGSKFILKYDLSWLDECGMDDDNVYTRNYDTAKAFPYIQCFKPPLYINMYPERITSLLYYKQYFISAILFMISLHKNTKFFFFSDEPQ